MALIFCNLLMVQLEVKKTVKERRRIKFARESQALYLIAKPPYQVQKRIPPTQEVLKLARFPQIQVAFPFISLYSHYGFLVVFTYFGLWFYHVKFLHLMNTYSVIDLSIYEYIMTNYSCSQTRYATFAINFSSSNTTTCGKGGPTWEKQVLLGKVVWFWFKMNTSHPSILPLPLPT